MAHAIMVDIETWSTRSNAAILAIGAVKFDAEFNIQDRFYCNVDPISCRNFGLHFDPDTIEFWRKNPEAFNQTKENRISIQEAISQFNEWIGPAKKTEVWANGAAFDFPILEWSFVQSNTPIPWEFWNVRDARTIYKLAGLDTKTFADREGTFHNAVDDCITQVRMLKSVFKPED